MHIGNFVILLRIFLFSVYLDPLWDGTGPGSSGKQGVVKVEARVLETGAHPGVGARNAPGPATGNETNIVINYSKHYFTLTENWMPSVWTCWSLSRGSRRMSCCHWTCSVSGTVGWSQSQFAARERVSTVSLESCFLILCLSNVSELRTSCSGYTGRLGLFLGGSWPRLQSGEREGRVGGGNIERVFWDEMQKF